MTLAPPEISFSRQGGDQLTNHILLSDEHHSAVYTWQTFCVRLLAVARII